MSYRFQRVFTGYPDYMRQFYAQRPDLAGQSYAAQLAAHLYNAAERSDSYSAALAALGCETDEIIADAGPMQKQWAREHDLRYDDAAWIPQIVLAQIKAFRPEALFLSSWHPAFNPAFVRECRAACPSIRMVIGWVGEAHPGAAYFAAHDLLLSCAPDTVAFMQSQGVHTRHLHHAFDPRILDRLAADSTPVEALDIGFIGHIYFGDSYHNARAQMFDAIARTVPFTIFGELPGMVSQPHGGRARLRAGYYAILGGLHRAGLGGIARCLPRHKAWRIMQKRAPYIPLLTRLSERARPAVYGLDMYRTLSGFRVCLNAHGPSAYASNLRLYESTGVGTCLLTDWKDNLPDLFEPDVEVATYRNPEEAVEKARYLLDHDGARRSIAAAGQRRTLRDHTIERRVERLHTYIEEFMQGQ